MNVWAIFVINWIAFIILMLGVNLFPRPLDAMWNTTLITEGKCKCSPGSVLVDIGEVATSVTIASDLALAVLPALILQDTSMNKETKFQILAL